MLVGKPILAGESDTHQLDIIFDLVGTPTDQTMPGWKQLPGAEAINPRPRPASLAQRFREHGSSAISLLKELLTLDWRSRINAIDALEHPYFKSSPLPAKPEDLPTFEDSHELDRRKFHDRKAALPPAPKGGTVGVGAFGGPNAEFGSGDGYGNRRYPKHHGGYRGGEEGRRPAWARDQPHMDHRLPPRPPPLSTQETDGITPPNITNHSGIGRRETVGLIGRMLTPTSLTTVMVIDRLEKTGHLEKIGHRGKTGHQEMIVEDGRIEIVDDVTGTVAKEITTTVAVRARHAAAAARPFGIGTETYIGDRIAISLGEEGQISHPRLRHLHLRRRLISPTGQYSPKLRTISIPLISSNSFYGRVCGQGMQQANGRTAAHGFVFGVLRYV